MRSVEWLNENKYRAYPFVEDAATAFIRTSPYRRYEVPPQLLLDFQLFDLTPDGADSNATVLDSIELDGTASPYPIVTFNFLRDGDAFSVPVVNTPNLAYPYEVRVESANYSLRLVLGCDPFEIFPELSAAHDTVSAETPVPLEPALIAVHNRHRVLSLTGDAPGSVAVAGDIFFEDGFSSVVRVSGTLNTVTIVGQPGAGRGVPCEDSNLTESAVITYTGLPSSGDSLWLQDTLFMFVDGTELSNELVDGAVYVNIELSADAAYHNLATAILAQSDLGCTVEEAAGALTLTGASVRGLTVITLDNASVVSSLGEGVVPCERAILWFNGQTADGNGNIKLQGGRGLVVLPDGPHGLLVCPRINTDDIGCAQCRETP